MTRATLTAAFLVLTASVMAASATVAIAGDGRAVRDCHPYNGPGGYYGNPWCDGGFTYDLGRPGPAGARWEYVWDRHDDAWRRRHHRRIDREDGTR